MRRRTIPARPVGSVAKLAEAIQDIVHPLRGLPDLDPLMECIGNAHVVCLGEASHGTEEFYTWRTLISERLIREKGFQFIAVEGDWPDCYRVNRFVKSKPGADGEAHEVLQAFNRWPTWMWANEEVVSLLEYLLHHNATVPDEQKVGFYGLDVYSLWDSLYAIIGYLQRVDPSGLPAAWRALRCFEPYGEDVQEFARATRFVANACEDEVVQLLKELRGKAPQYRADGRDCYLDAEQNAFVLKNAEMYYRTMVRGGPESWNVRDRHMAATLDRLLRHHGPVAKAIVWEHNTHVGDARYTDMAAEGMVNVGQLVRERYGEEEVVLVGFGSHRGSVIAARAWEAPLERMPVPSAQEGSWDEVLHGVSPEDKMLIFERESTPELLEGRGQRAIGVVYHPEYEQWGNYIPTVLPRRYDALLYLEETHALHPLAVAEREEMEVPETYPSGV